MKVSCLIPMPEYQTQFAWPYNVTVPDQPGCYAIVAYSGEVLYVGLASSSIKNRMASHLDTPAKRKAAPHGIGYWFYYTVRNAIEVNAIERGWMNQAILADGDIPPLNRIYSPL